MLVTIVLAKPAPAGVVSYSFTATATHAPWVGRSSAVPIYPQCEQPLLMSAETQTDCLAETSTSTMEQIVRRVRSLYSLPAVAAEVIQLTSNPKVDARVLKECIEKDPALTAKILRVVNSSLFGLSREVSDLNQALALLGTKPLKLLVLGFSLPEELFAEVARPQLDWYWTTTLTRAVAAREISEQLWQRSGDDAFLAGLLQDIGVLVLLRELREPYAKFLSRAIDQQIDLHRMEFDSLGFDHTELSAALLEHWNMPELLVRSISHPRDYRRLAHQDSPHAEMAQIIHLAGLLAGLVGEKKLSVLPDLLEAGEAYCGLDKDRLTKLVALLQPKVQQLADVLSLDLPEGANYAQVLVEAHAQMSELVEGVVEPLSRPCVSEEELQENLLADATRLRTAVEKFLRFETPITTQQQISISATKPAEKTDQASLSKPVASLKIRSNILIKASFVNKLTLAVGQCRSRRKALSVLLLEVGDKSGEDVSSQQYLAQVLDAACRAVDVDEVIVELCAPCCRAIVLPQCERQEAVRHAYVILSSIEKALERLRASGASLEGVVSAGVASVGLPPKNFPPLSLIETAERCLAAAQSGGANVVKSLEIY